VTRSVFPGATGKGYETILALVALPPPTHGQALVNAAVVERLKGLNDARVTVIDTGPGQSTRNLIYHTTRACRVAAALCGEIQRARHESRTVYTVIESGWGKLYNLLILGAGRLLGYRLILHHHTSAHILGDSLSFRWLARLAGPRTIHVVVGLSMASDLKRRYPEIREVMIVHNACVVPLPQKATPVGTEPPRLRLGFLSNLSREKGLDIVLEVLRAGKSAGLDIVLRLAGPATTTEAAAEIAVAKEEFGPALEVLGPVSDEAKTEFYENIDLFLFPSNYRYEAQPLVVIEAMAHGRPLIVSDRGYIAELVDGAAEIAGDRLAFVSTTIDLCRQWSANSEMLHRRAEASHARFIELRANALNDLDHLMERISDHRS
jgi:glycosyltransferase involved in cell wall biosynthesis